LITFKVNPFKATSEYLAATGIFALDSMFPVYKPIITDSKGNEITTPEGYTIQFDFVVPPDGYSTINMY
jgi:hypothetical protein